MYVRNAHLVSPQLTQWRQFEEEVNPHPSQMAKYFSSPSKSLRSMYSEDEIYYLLGENDSMKRLISEVHTHFTLPTYVSWSSIITNSGTTQAFAYRSSLLRTLLSSLV